MKLSVHNQLVKALLKYKRGKIVFPSDFLELGNEALIHKIFSRLVLEGMLVRLAHGIYLYPKVDPELGILYPSLEEIAKAVAKKERVRILPTGLNALQKLGFSTQVPMKVVYLTDGMSRNIKVGKRHIVFKKSAPKKFATKGKLTTLVIQSLQEIGRNNISPEVLDRIETVLKNEDLNIIKTDAGLAPAWIGRLLFLMIPKLKRHA